MTLVSYLESKKKYCKQTEKYFNKVTRNETKES